MNRRRFINTVALASLVKPSSGAVEVEVVRPATPFDALLRDIEPGRDEFPLEKKAAETAAHLKGLVGARTLPFAPGMRGFSPMPKGYREIAKGVSKAEYDPHDGAIADGLRKWIDAFGPIRAARFFVLPQDIIRFEIAAGNTYRIGSWRQQWVDGRITLFEPLEETVTTSPQPLFIDVTGHGFRDSVSFDRQLRLGVNYWRARLDAACGIDVHGHNGIAAGDIDGDGFDEIYVCQPGGLPNRLYRNRGDGSFEDITDAAGVGVLDVTSSALFLDLRNSGLQDLVVLRPEGPLLFVNEGQSRFRFQPGAFRFQTQPQGSFTGMAAADYDRDGRLDLYLCTYSFFRDGSQYRYPAPYYDAQNGPPNYFFRNELTREGGGAFIDVTEAVGLNHNNNRFSFAPAWCDYNGDGWPDLYVANDFGRNNLYRNENGRFRDVAAEAGVEDPGDGMSASWFDYDGDGQPDLYISNMWSDAGQRVVAEKRLQPEAIWRRHAKGNSLYRWKGDGTFEETGAIEGVEMGRWAWSSGGFDFDNDGEPEIFAATGMLTNESETDLESFFWRKVAAASPDTARSDIRYENGWNALSQAAHEKYSEAGRQPNVFYVRRNGRYYDFSGVSGLDVAEDSRAFAVTDIDGDGNLDLILKSRSGPQVRVFRNNGTHNRKSIVFRLRGVQSNQDAIGARVVVDGRAKFVEAGSGYLSQHTKSLFFGLDNRDIAKAVSITWPTGLVQKFEDLAAGFVYDIAEAKAELRKTQFSASGQTSGAPVTGTNSAKPSDTWLLEPIPLPEHIKGPAFLRIDNERTALYSVFCRYLFDLRYDLKPPVWLLVDEQSRARKIYFSTPDQKDLKAFQPPALPFPGKYYTSPQRNYTALGAAFSNAGYSEQALRYLELAPQNSDKVLFAIGRIHLQAARWNAARSYLERGLKLSPGSGDGWNNLGSVDAAEGNFVAALASYEKALALRPDMTAAMVNAGQAWAARGNADRAEKMFRQALGINPRDAAAANQMGELFVRSQRDNEAKAWFQRAIANGRDYAPAVGNLGALYARMGQKNDAIAAFLYGIEIAPGDESFYLNLANVYVASGDRQRAREALELLLTRDSRNINAAKALRGLDNH